MAGGTSDLYTIDPVSLSATLVGTITPDVSSPDGDLAFDRSGSLYVLDDAGLYAVDLATLTATLLGRPTAVGTGLGFGWADGGIAFATTTTATPPSGGEVVRLALPGLVPRPFADTGTALGGRLRRRRAQHRRRGAAARLRPVRPRQRR